MKTNVGKADKVIRLILAAIFVILYFTGAVSGTLGIVLLVLALVLVITTLTGFCGLYRIFGINTCAVKK